MSTVLVVHLAWHLVKIDCTSAITVEEHLNVHEGVESLPSRLNVQELACGINQDYKNANDSQTKERLMGYPVFFTKNNDFRDV